jgi:predicted membrane protein
MDEDKPIPRGPRSRIWTGLFLLLVGAVLLLDQMGFPLPYWLFSWHTFLVALGLFIGFRHNFRGGLWLILIFIGLVLGIQDYYPDLEIHRFLLPGILILIGLAFVLNPRGGPFSRRHQWKNEWKHQWKQQWRNEKHQWKNEWKRERHQYRWNYPVSAASSTHEGYSSEDYIDATAFFGGVHKKIVSKTFKGGDIVTILGGTELDLTQADFTGVVKLDVVQIMGGTKIIVPAHWEVRSEVTAVFAGFEDKRQQPTVSNPEKVLVIEGTSIFGGIELKNF